MTDEELGQAIRRWNELPPNRVISLTCYVDEPDYAPQWEALLLRLDSYDGDDSEFHGTLAEVVEGMTAVLGAELANAEEET